MMVRLGSPFMDIFKPIRLKAKKNPKRIILPEGGEERVVEAARQITKAGIADVILLGKREKISAGCEVIDPYETNRLERYAAAYYELRKHKGITFDEAKAIITENIVFPAALMVRLGEADGFVAGAAHTTKDVAKAAIHCIGAAQGIRTISSFFVMVSKNKRRGENGVFLFSDCAIVPDPTASQLCDIALSTAKVAKTLFGFEPRVAMLSYSTKGSGAGASVERIVEATRLIKEQSPELIVDGEFQADAAVDPQVAAVKSPHSAIKGDANILIFPDLDAGNIAYKLCQRIGGMRAIGPFLQGLSKPASDLSRGCDPSDIVDAVAVVSAQAN